MSVNSKPLVLVADDDTTTIFMLRHILEREGYRVEHVANGLDAVQAATTLLPDLILLDILMPGIDGFDVVRKLREMSVTANIPTIMMTANAREPADVERGLKLGADDYIYKPFAPQELLARAHIKIRSRQLEEKLQQRTRELEVIVGASELLNQHLDKSELLELSPSLLLDLLPGEVVAITLDVHTSTDRSRLMTRNISLTDSEKDALIIGLQQIPIEQGILVWDVQSPIRIGDFPNGIVAELDHGGNIIGRVAIFGMHTTYEPNQSRLFGGIIRQIALALHNAHLYEVELNYANQLETMVAERTAKLESAQKMLLRSEKLASIGHLAASIAHEINNPLMPIRTLLEGIVEELEERHIDYDRMSVEIIQSSIERIRKIVSRLLEFSRDTDTMALFNLNDVLETVVSLNRKFFQHEHIQINTDFQPLPEIFGSKDQLEQVLMNIALNAQAAMPSGGALAVKTYTEGHFVVAEIADTGIGIAPDDMNKIFDPFFSTKPNGTGLGLFVSHGIIEAHNGTIDVKSTVNQGTTFTVKLPYQTT